jgi:hypothetical protein
MGLTAGVRITMFPLLEVPRGALFAILRDWICSGDVGKMDSAMCSASERPILLGLFRSSCLVLTTATFDGSNTADANKFLEWMVRKEIKAREWIFCNDLEQQLIIKLAQRTGGPHVLVLTFRDMKEETAAILLSIFSVCENISKVSISNTEHWTGLGLLSERSSHVLRELSIIRCGTNSLRRFGLNSFASVRSLILWGDYTAATVNNLLQACPTLVVVQLRLVYLDDVAFQTLVNKTRHMRVLTLSACRTSVSVAVISPPLHGAGFRTFGISGCAQLPGSALEALAQQCWRLERLQLLHRGMAGLQMIVRYSFHTLTHLSLVSVDVNRDLISVQYCSNLTELELADCRGVSDSDLVWVIDMMPRLQNLLLPHCSFVTDAVLRAVARNYPTLQDLSLFCSTGYSEDAALTLIQSLTHLKRFSIEPRHPVFTHVVLGVWRDRLPGLAISYASPRPPSSYNR